MRVHLSGRQRPDVEPALRRLELLVVVPGHLRHVRRLEELRRLPPRDTRPVAGLAHLVAQRPALHGAAKDLAHVALRLHRRSVVVAQLHGGHRRQLLVPAQEETVLDVRLGGHLQVALQVVHAVLRDVRDAQVVVLPDRARARLELAHDVLQERRLPRAVGADNRDAARERHPRVHAVQHGNGVGPPRVREPDVVHAKHNLLSVLDAVQAPGVGERNERLGPRGLGGAAAEAGGHRRREAAAAARGGARAEVLQAHPRARGGTHLGRAIARGGRVVSVADGGDAIGGGAFFDRFHQVALHARQHQVGLLRAEAREPALVRAQALVLEVHDVGGDVREEVVVVRHHEHGGVPQRLEVARQPLHGADVQVVRGLVQEQQVSLLEHGARERQAHAPAPRQLRDCFPHRVLREPDRLQARRRVARVRAHLARARLDETENGGLHRGEHFVLHEDAAQVFGPAVYVPRGETRQQGGLPRAVLADHAVLASPHESKVRRLQKHLPGEREDDPSQIQTVFDGVVVVPSGGGPVLAVLAAPAAREMTHGALEEGRDRVVVDELAQHGARGVHEFLHHLLRRPPGLALGQELARHVGDVLAHLLIHGRRGQQGLDVRQHIRDGHLARRRRRCLRPQGARAACCGRQRGRKGSFRVLTGA